MHGVVDALPVAHLVEDEKLRLRAKIGRFADTDALEVSLGLLGDVASVTAIGLAGEGVSDVANQNQRRRRRERIEEGRGRIWDDQHVAFLDLLKPPYGRAIEADALLESIRADGARWDGKMLPDARQVGKSQIDHLSFLVLDRFEDVLGRGTV